MRHCVVAEYEVDGSAASETVHGRPSQIVMVHNKRLHPFVIATWCDDEGMKAFIVDHDDLGWSAVYGFGGGAPIYFVLRDDTVPHDRLREQIGYQDMADAHWQDDPTLDDGPPAPLCVTRELTWAEILGHRSEVGTPLQ